MSRLLSSRHDSFNSSAGTILPEARESDIRSTSTSTSLDPDVPPTLGIGLHAHTHTHTHTHTPGLKTAQPRAAPNNVASLSSARVLMPQNTLGRELIELMQNQDLDGLMQSNSQESQDFANMVRDYTQLDSVSQSRTDLRSFVSRSNPDLAAFVNPSIPATDLLAQIQADHPGVLSHGGGGGGGAPSSPIKPDIYNTHAPITHPNPLSISTTDHISSHAASSSYPPRVEAFRPTSAHSNHSVYSHHSHRHGGGSVGGSAHSNASASDYEYCTTEVDEDESRLPIELQGQVDVDPRQLHIGAPAVVGGRGRSKKANRAARGDLGAEGTALPHLSGGVSGKGGKGAGEYDEEALRLKRLEHRRQINRKSAQKHRMRRREEHESLSKQMVEKDARIAQLEKDLAVERSKTAQLQQFIDMQRMGSKRAARGGGRLSEDVEMDDDDE